MQLLEQLLIYHWIAVFLCAPFQATNLSSNGSVMQADRDPKENKVRSMATQLQAKFENKNNFIVRKTQVETHQWVSRLQEQIHF